MRLRFTLTEGDYIEAQLAYARQHPASLWCLRVVGVAAGLCIVGGLAPGLLDLYLEHTLHAKTWVTGTPALILGILLTLYLTTFRERLIRSDFRKHPNLHGEKTWDFNDERIDSSSDIGRSELLWKAIVEWKETQKQFLLFFGKRLFCIFPKSIFAAGEEDEFRELLKRRLPQ